MPADGLVSGKSGGKGPLAVCRSTIDNGQHPGKLWEGQCNVEWGRREYRISDYEVLLDNRFSWVNPGKSLPDNAVDSGDAGDAARHVRLGICQAYIASDNTWHPGKFYANYCYIAWGGKGRRETPNANGDVLVLVKQ